MGAIAAVSGAARDLLIGRTRASLSGPRLRGALWGVQQQCQKPGKLKAVLRTKRIKGEDDHPAPDSLHSPYIDPMIEAKAPTATTPATIQTQIGMASVERNGSLLTPAGRTSFWYDGRPMGGS